MTFQTIPETYSPSRHFNSYEPLGSNWSRLKTKTTTTSKYVKKWLHQSDMLETLSRQNHALVLLRDIQSDTFVYAVDHGNVLVDDANRYIEPDGLNYSLSKYPPRSRLAAKMMQEIGLEYYTAHADDPKNFLMSHDIDYMRGNELIHVLQQTSVLEASEEGQPLLHLTFIYDISHLKKQVSSTLVVNTQSESILYNYDFDRQKVELVPRFTDKEQQVLQMLACGKNTKEISVQLFSSPHTIDTHRRNLLAKTNCVDTTALVTYCKMVGVL